MDKKGLDVVRHLLAMDWGRASRVNTKKKRRPKDWREKKKARCKIAKASRKINRQRKA